MKPLIPSSRPCCPGSDKLQTDLAAGRSSLPTLLFGAGGLVLWFLVYRQLEPFSRYLSHDLLSIPVSPHLGVALQFFLYDTPKVLMLLTLVVFFIGIVRTFFTPERTRKILAGKRQSAGNVLAALLGIVTPFCSCSAVPLFIGFVTAGVPFPSSSPHP